MSDVLRINNLNAFWKDAGVFKNINLELKSEGKLICLCGPNGSGKSTLLSLLTGIVPEGLSLDKSILLNDENLFSIKKQKCKFNSKEIAKKISYLAQNEFSLWNHSVLEEVVTGRFCHTKINGHYSDEDFFMSEEMLSLLGIKFLSQKNIHSLSGGEMQKVRIARALVQQTDFILFDEIAANLDVGYQKELMEFFKSICVKGLNGKKPLIVISIHDINLALQYADEIILLKKYKFIQDKEIEQLTFGSIQEVITEESLKLTFGSNFGFFTHPEYKCTQVYVK